MIERYAPLLLPTSQSGPLLSKSDIPFATLSMNTICSPPSDTRVVHLQSSGSKAILLFHYFIKIEKLKVLYRQIEYQYCPAQHCEDAAQTERLRA